MVDADGVGANSNGNAPVNSVFKLEQRDEQVAILKDTVTKLLITSSKWSGSVNRAKPNTVDVFGVSVNVFSIEHENAERLAFVDEQILKALSELAKKGVESPLYNLFVMFRQDLALNVTLGGTLLLARLGSTLELLAQVKRSQDFWALSELEKRGIAKRKKE